MLDPTDPDRYEPVVTTSILVNSCHMCFGLHQFCLDYAIYYCKRCKHHWQRRMECQYTNPKAYHHFQGYPVNPNG